MKLVLAIHLDNASFEDDPNLELEVILEHFAEEIANSAIRVGSNWTIRDTNGNKIGHAAIMAS